MANDVSAATGTFGGDANTVHLIDDSGAETWPRLPKDVSIQIGGSVPQSSALSEVLVEGKIKNVAQMIDLHVVGRDHQNILVAERSLRALTVDPDFAEQRRVGLLEALGFRRAALREAGVVHRDKA